MKYLWKSFQCGIPQGHHYFHHFPHLFQWLDLHYTRFHMFSFSNGSNAKINCYPIMPFMFHSHFSSTNAVFKTWLYFHFCGMISSFTYQFLSVVTIVYHWDTETNNIIMSEHEQNNKCTVTNHQHTLRKVAWLDTNHNHMLLHSDLWIAELAVKIAFHPITQS